MLATRERPRSGQKTPDPTMPIMRHDDEALDLLVARIRERKHRPVAIAFARAHVHAPDDAVRSGRGGHQDAIAIGAMALGCIREIDRRQCPTRTLMASTARAGIEPERRSSISTAGTHARTTTQPAVLQAPPLSILPRAFAGATIRAGRDASQLYAYFAAHARADRQLRSGGRWSVQAATEKTGNSINCKRKYNLADVCAAFHARMGGGCLRERKSAVDQRAQRCP